MRASVEVSIVRPLTFKSVNIIDGKYKIYLDKSNKPCDIEVISDGYRKCSRDEY